MNAIITEARSWIGTPFHHQGRVRYHGVDCIGLIVGVAHALGFEPEDSADYPPEPDGIKLKAGMDKNLISVPLEEMQAGHIVLFRIYKHPQHVGILADYAAGGLSLIHAHQKTGAVVEHHFSQMWRERIVGIYALR